MTQPQDFNIFKIYSKVAEDLYKENPIISYYLKTYILNKALEYLKAERSQGKDVSDRTQEIKVWLQDLENCKIVLNTQLGDKEHCKQIFKDFTQNLYQKSDHDYKNANYTRTLARDFLYVSVLFDAWELLGAQTEETKQKKNYSNQARFKIMDALTNGVKPNIPQQPVTNQYQGNQLETPKPTENPATGPKEEHTVDPMSKINFDLTESIVVPQNSIDKFLGPNTKKPENTSQPHDNKPISDIHSNTTQPNNYTKWNLPVGKSMAFDENATPATNPQSLDPHHHHLNPITRQKTPPTVFYAPRHTPSLHQNLNPTPIVEDTPTGETTPRPEEIMETPGEGQKPTPNVSIISKKQESHYNIKNQESTIQSNETHHQETLPNQPENLQYKIQEAHQSVITNPNQTHHFNSNQVSQNIQQNPSVFGNPQSKVLEAHQSVIKPNEALLNHPENIQSNVQGVYQSIIKPNEENGQSKVQDQHQSVTTNPNQTHHFYSNQVSQNIQQNPSVFGNPQSKVLEAHQSVIKPNEALPNHPENTQSNIQGHQSIIKPNEESTQFKVQESHYSIPKISQNLQQQPQSAILENAKPVTSTFTYDQSQHFSNINDTESRVPLLDNQSMKKDSFVAPSNPQSVFNQNQSHFSNPPEANQSNIHPQDVNISKASNLQGENANPNLSTVQGSAFSNQGNGDDKVLKCKGVKDICLRAIIDLNATNTKEARQKLQQALQILNEME